MTTPPSLGPLSTAEIFDTAFRLYRAHLPTFLRTAFSLYGPLILLKFILAILFLDSSEWDYFLAWPLPLGLPYGFALNADTTPILLTIMLRILELFFLQPITIGILCNAAAQAYLQQPLTHQTAFKLDQPHFASFLLTGAVNILINITIIMSGQTYIYSGITKIAPVMLIAFIGSIIIYIRLIIVPAVIVVEGYRPLASWVRSWKLGRGTKWQALQIVVLSNLLMAILVFPFGLSVRAIIQYLMQSMYAELPGFFVGHCLWVISFTFQAIVYTVFYYNLRVRKEGYDLVIRLGQNTSIYSSHWGIKDRRLPVIIIMTCLVIIATIALFFFLFLAQPPIA